jgi:hypothetical protein
MKTKSELKNSTENQLIKSISVYENMNSIDRSKKVKDSVIRKSNIPLSLVEDASQEIDIAWFKAKVNPKFSDNEVTSYASRIAIQLLLKFRKAMCNTLTLPDNAFCKNKTGKTYMEESKLKVGSDIEFDNACVFGLQNSMQQINPEYDCLTDSEIEESSNFIDEKLSFLSAKQRDILKLFAKGDAMSDVEEEMNIKSATISRLVRGAASAIKEHNHELAV